MNFEVQSQKAGKWVIESIHDGKDEAIYDAQRIIKGNANKSVRVVEEIYDPATDSFRAKVIFRRARSVEKKVDSILDELPEHMALEPEPGIYEELWQRIVDRWNAILRPLRAFARTWYYLLLKFVVIIGLGLWLLYTLYGLADKF